MKKVKAITIVCGWIIGTIGGIVFALAGGSLPCAAGVVILSVISWPRFRESLAILP